MTAFAFLPGTCDRNMDESSISRNAINLSTVHYVWKKVLARVGYTESLHRVVEVAPQSGHLHFNCGLPQHVLPKESLQESRFVTGALDINRTLAAPSKQKGVEQHDADSRQVLNISLTAPIGDFRTGPLATLTVGAWAIPGESVYTNQRRVRAIDR
jgi:hypothetical protein